MLERRAFLAVCSRLGLATTLLPGVLWAMADEKGKVTRRASIAVDKAPLSLRARSGIDPRRSRQAVALCYWSRIGFVR